MHISYRRYLSTAVLSAALLIVVASPAAASGNIKIGHLTYHTGEYASFGPFFDAVTDFTLDVINQSPPLGRTLTAIHEDVGTIGEWRAVRKLLDKSNVDVLLNVAHEYPSYRDYLLKRIDFLHKPLLPSVHGGAIDANYGGVPGEPLFRGSPMDSAQSVAAVLHVKESGKQKVVLVANELEGHLMQMRAAQKTAESLGLQVLNTIVMQPDWTDFASVVKQVAAEKPDAVIVFSSPRNGGIFVRNAAQAGHSWFLVGTSEWQEPDFIEEATLAAVRSHESVVLSAYAKADSPAWAFYKEAAEASVHIDAIGDMANSYAMQYYDLLVASALAIEKAGGVDAKTWAAAMFDVTDGQGEIVYTYSEGVAAIRAGKEINYDGVTGSMEFTNTGVVAGLFGIFKWTDMNRIEQVAVADGEIVAELDQE